MFFESKFIFRNPKTTPGQNPKNIKTHVELKNANSAATPEDLEQSQKN